MSEADESLVSRPAPATIYRLSRGPDPWDWPDWAFAKPDNTFGNRWDDPLGVYRVLYASSQRLGTFVETLARFRPDAAIIAALDEFEDDPEEVGPAALRPGEVPRSWLDNRRLGEGYVEGDFVEVGHSSSLAWLHVHLAARLVHYMLTELDASVVRISAPRRLTQEISRKMFELTVEGSRRYAGIAYLSRLGDEFQNWAIFEPADLSRRLPRNIAPEDEDLATALQRLGLTLVDG